LRGWWSARATPTPRSARWCARPPAAGLAGRPRPRPRRSSGLLRWPGRLHEQRDARGARSHTCSGCQELWRCRSASQSCANITYPSPDQGRGGAQTLHRTHAAVTGAHVTGDSNGPVLHLRPVRRGGPLRRPRAGLRAPCLARQSNVARRRCLPCLCAMPSLFWAPDLPALRAPARPARVALRGLCIPRWCWHMFKHTSLRQRFIGHARLGRRHGNPAAYALCGAVYVVVMWLQGFVLCKRSVRARARAGRAERHLATRVACSLSRKRRS